MTIELTHGSAEATTGLKSGRLNTMALVFLIIAASAPLTVLAGGGTHQFRRIQPSRSTLWLSCLGDSPSLFRRRLWRDELTDSKLGCFLRLCF